MYNQAQTEDAMPASTATMSSISPNSHPILVIGAGPVGMILSYALSRLSIPVILFDKSPAQETTQYPKMDYTNSRSMELLRNLGLADQYRSLEGAVDRDTKFESVFTTSLGLNGKELGRWSVPSVNEQRAESRRSNDGSYASEPGQRCSQIVFEKWMRELILDQCQGVSFRGGWKYIGHEEKNNQVTAKFVALNGKQHTVSGRYLVGCDGGRSAVRKHAGIKMIGTQLPARFHLVHFRSKHFASELDLQGRRFWHAFPTGSGFVIDQDGNDTFTAHCPLTDSAEDSTLSPHQIVSRVLGGSLGPWPVTIDKVLVHSKWQPSFAIANQYISDKGNVLLAGDAAHLNPPHGGYGLNSGIVDAVDLSWRLAAVAKGYGGDLLLSAYNIERRPMMMRALRRSHRHLMEHIGLAEMYSKKENWAVLNSDCEDGKNFRQLMKQFLHLSGLDTTDWGIELDLRYDYSPYIWPGSTAPSSTSTSIATSIATVPWTEKKYHPSTKPGHRAPHVFLRDEATSIYDLLGPEWTLVHFTNETKDIIKADSLLRAAETLNFPVKHVILRNEEHARRIWERDLVLVRPDTHVAWRGNDGLKEAEAEQVLAVVLGRVVRPGYSEKASSIEEGLFRETLASFAGGPGGGQEQGQDQTSNDNGRGDSRL